MGRPMPPGIRATIRSRHHAATAVPCPHCHAHEGQPCRLPSKRATLRDPHPSRIAQHAAVAESVCPACQVTPGTPCRRGDGQPLDGVHPQRLALLVAARGAEQ